MNPQKLLNGAVTFGVIALVGSFFFWFGWLNHVSINEVGIAYNAFSGKITIQKDPGWHVTSPLTLVTKMTTVPMRVSIVSDARLINSKLVQFDPEHIDEFLKVQGWSWSLDSKEANILLGYAYSGGKYKFLKILEEPDQEHALKEEEAEKKKTSQ